MTQFISSEEIGGNAAANAKEVASHGVGRGARPMPMVSIIVPVLNEEAFMADTLDMLLAQDYPRSAVEILVVDGGSTDRTREIVKEFIRRNEPVRLIDNSQRWSSAARNLGVRHSCGELVLVIDGHCELPDRSNLRWLVNAFEISGCDIVGRPQPLIVTGATALQQAIAWARASWLGHHPDSYVYCEVDQMVPAQSVGAAYRKSVFDRVGMFDESFDACEDVDFNYRADKAGLTCFFSWNTRVHYHPRRTLSELFRQLARYGRGRVRLSRKHPETWSWKSMAPAAWVATWVVLLILSPVSAVAFRAWIAMNVSYLSVILLTTFWIAWRKGFCLPVLWLPFVFATIHSAAGTGSLMETILGRTRDAGQLASRPVQSTSAS